MIAEFELATSETDPYRFSIIKDLIYPMKKPKYSQDL